MEASSLVSARVIARAPAHSKRTLHRILGQADASRLCCPQLPHHLAAARAMPDVAGRSLRAGGRPEASLGYDPHKPSAVAAAIREPRARAVAPTCGPHDQQPTESSRGHPARAHWLLRRREEPDRRQKRGEREDPPALVFAHLSPLYPLDRASAISNHPIVTRDLQKTRPCVKALGPSPHDRHRI